MIALCVVYACAIVLVLYMLKEPAPVISGESPDLESPSDRPPLEGPLSSPRIVVAKTARRLTLFSHGKAVRTYRTGLGFSPEGDKHREGDGRTPEGDFYVCTKNPNSRYTLSLGLSYPGVDDAERGLANGAITQDEHDAIVRAITAGKTPPWKTALGGEIFIHGRGAGSDWTLGCIALDDEDIQELYPLIPVGTPVRIEP
jgi:murein L,D-transpeptidase YafK